VRSNVFCKVYHKSQFDAKKKYIYKKTPVVKDVNGAHMPRSFDANFVFDGVQVSICESIMWLRRSANNQFRVQSTDELMIELYKEKLLGDSLVGAVVLPVARYLMHGECVLCVDCNSPARVDKMDEWITVTDQSRASVAALLVRMSVKRHVAPPVASTSSSSATSSTSSTAAQSALAPKPLVMTKTPSTSTTAATAAATSATTATNANPLSESVRVRVCGLLAVTSCVAVLRRRLEDSVWQLERVLDRQGCVRLLS
jgi:hypothetical protein